jgi:hypothetical protein
VRVLNIITPVCYISSVALAIVSAIADDGSYLLAGSIIGVVGVMASTIRWLLGHRPERSSWISVVSDAQLLILGSALLIVLTLLLVWAIVNEESSYYRAGPVIVVLMIGLLAIALRRDREL